MNGLSTCGRSGGFTGRSGVRVSRDHGVLCNSFIRTPMCHKYVLVATCGFPYSPLLIFDQARWTREKVMLSEGGEG